MIENNDLKRLTLKESSVLLLQQWLSSLNAYGIPKIFRSNLNFSLRILWTCCFIASFGYCVYLLVQLIGNYLNFPSYISTQIYQEIPAQFPAVSFCNLKPVNISTNSSLIKSVPLIQNFISIFEWISSLQYKMRIKVFSETNTTLRKNYGYQLENMLVSCTFNYNPCNASSFKYFYDPNLGNCYTFNKGIYDDGTSYPINTVTIPGLAYGLTLEIFVGNPANETLYEYNDGVVISIDNQTSLPFTEGDVIKAAAGSETDLIINRNFITKLPSPYGNCIADTSSTSKFDSVFLDYIVKTKKIEYSQKYCYSLCLQYHIMTNCNCSNLNLPIFNNSNNICSAKYDVFCMNLQVNNFASSNSSKICTQKCPYKCETIDYQINSYRALYPTNYYSQILYNYSLSKGLNIAYNDIGKSFAKVNVYYNSMEYTKTQQTISMDPSTLFSSIFGTINFCLGMNIFTMVEIFELLVFLVVIIVTYSKPNSKIFANKSHVNT
jgi:hypothetical protein